MQWLIDNWTLLASLLAAAALAVIKVQKYLKLSETDKAKAEEAAKAKLTNAVSDWLLRAVTEAERELGGGTGKLKIRAVYERALEVFGPELAQIITLEQLDAMAQTPLEEMRKMLEANSSAAEYVKQEDHKT